jgi:tetratricopeptide (TPR) repeat protein
MDTAHRLSWRSLWRAIPTIVTIGVVLIVIVANWRDARRTLPPPILPLGTPGASDTSRPALEDLIDRMRTSIAADPSDGAAAITLADALMRQTRVTGNAGLVVEAERALRSALDRDPENYEARRLMGAVYLAQHRFREAIAWAKRASAMRPSDAWNYGVQTDGLLELGEYERAETTLAAMMERRPGAPAYARASYLLELRGNLPGALAEMRMAAEATSPHDPEAQAWHHSQIGDLLLQMGQVTEAEREYARAGFFFERHPFAAAGLARVKAAQGRLVEAAHAYEMLMATAPSPDLAAALGDVRTALGDNARAEQSYALAEAGWRVDVPQPALLARFLAERDRKVDEAYEIAVRAAADRHDIYTMDALAWAAYRTGRIAEARRASTMALRTNTADRRILYHAAEIARAARDDAGAARLVERALDGHEQFDPVLGPSAVALQRQLSRAANLARR